MLKMTVIELELISDNDMHLFIEKGMRGGISHITKRYIEKQIINTWNVMILVLKANLLCTWMQIIYMVGQWVNISLRVDLNGEIKKKLISLM